MFIPEGLSRGGRGLAIGGVDAELLAREYGTPLYVINGDVFRARCREYTHALREFYPGPSTVAYASKALCASFVYRILMEEGMGADVASGGELYTALRAGFPPDRIYFHGNNKTEAELRYGVESGVRRFVLDNARELEALDAIALELGAICDVSFRVKPGIDAHTHEFIQTGKIDSKFGVALETGEALAFARRICASKALRLRGVHCHIGSQIFEKEPFLLAARVMLDFIAEIRRELSVTPEELDLGGGAGISYLPSDSPPPIRDMVKAAAREVVSYAKELSLPLPKLVFEPGRSIAGPSGTTLYTVGEIKDIPHVRTYALIDGGMTDNPRYALYGAIYNIESVKNPFEKKDFRATIAGRCCESGDIITPDAPLQRIKAGDLIAVTSTGAYNYSMASNYNRMPRPAVVLVENGEHRAVVRRETYEDITACDL